VPFIKNVTFDDVGTISKRTELVFCGVVPVSTQVCRTLDVPVHALKVVSGTPAVEEYRNIA